MPIVDEVFKVLYENKNPKESLRDLMLRTLKVE
jgi:glycerol-3-phosphate dehydrogenase (NAD(P)+)